ncbi:MAG: DUF2190 family protein [Planctomycetota bacterium]|nr:DUF2190 family protein [Planctomycetota bacterium]
MLSTALYKNPHGIAFKEVTAMVVNRSASAVAIGDVMMFDFAASDSLTEGYDGSDSGPTTIYGAVIDNTVPMSDSYPLCVAITAAAADGDTFKVGLVGVFGVNLVSSDITAVGEALHSSTAASLTSDVLASQRIVGIAMVATAAATTEVVDCFFCGTGLGVS